MQTTSALLCILFFTLVVSVLRRRSYLPLPPGPRGFPIVGYLFERPTRDVYQVYTKWREIYGDIVSYNVLGQTIIVVNSPAAAHELFEKRSSNYSDRPTHHMLNLMNMSWNLVTMRYSDDWRLHRKTFHQHFNEKRISSLEPVQAAATVTLLKHLLVSPEGFMSHIRHHAGSIILRIIYGYSAQPVNDPYVELIDRAVRGVGLAFIFGSHMVDYIPVLRWLPPWFPFAPSSGHAKTVGEDLYVVRNGPFESTLKRAAEGDGIASRSFVATNLDTMKEDGISAERINEVTKNVAGIAFGAAGDTTVAAALSTILAMIHHPDVQAKAHAELDAVVGRHRMPTFEDQERLPYIRAVVLEALRWRPVNPLPIAHGTVADDVYEGYYIPAGATIIGNSWSILHDEEIYKDAQAYKPERFLGDNPEPHPMTMGSFGFGRRICPGRYFALNTLFIAVSSLLWAFEISKSPEEEQPPDVSPKGYGDFVVLHPLPFKCEMKPRFEEVRHIVESAEMAAM